MTIDGEDDLAGLTRAGRAVAEARDAMLAAAAPGVTTADLDAVGRDVLRAPRRPVGAPARRRVPAATCVSVNDEAAHGIPSPTRVLRAGDLVNVDVSAELDGYWADTGASAPVGPPESIDPVARRLVAATREAQGAAMNAARAGRPLRHVGRAVERAARRRGFSVIANLCGHGVGGLPARAAQRVQRRGPHDPTVLWEGLVLAVEPFLSTGATMAIEDGDGWTLRTPDRSLSAQFEHTIVVTQASRWCSPPPDRPHHRFRPRIWSLWRPDPRRNRLGGRQWRKWRSPVKTIATPSSSARAMFASSRTDPPGWMMTATPAAAAASMPSGNG